MRKLFFNGLIYIICLLSGIYLGGNGLYCDVEFLDEQTCIYRNDDERKLRHATEGVPYKDRPLESRFNLRHESEASLLGVVYDDRAIMTAAPYRVVDAGHWVFEGTGLRKGNLFGQASLHERVPGGASGHETDKISKSSPPGTRLLAKGTNPNAGGAEMVIVEAAGRGAVFSAASINWVSSVLVDDVISSITRNVLHRFVSNDK